MGSCFPPEFRLPAASYFIFSDMRHSKLKAPFTVGTFTCEGVFLRRGIAGVSNAATNYRDSGNRPTLTSGFIGVLL